MPRKLTIKEWLVREATDVAKHQLRQGIRAGAEHALPVLKEAGNRAQKLWSGWRKGAKKEDLLEAVNFLQLELHSERLAHEKRIERLKRALARKKKERPDRRMPER